MNHIAAHREVSTNQRLFYWLWLQQSNQLQQNHTLIIFYCCCCHCTAFHHVPFWFGVCHRYLVSFYDFHLLANARGPCWVDLNTNHFMQLDVLICQIYSPICLLGTFPLPLLALSEARSVRLHHWKGHFVQDYLHGPLAYCGYKRDAVISLRNKKIFRVYAENGPQGCCPLTDFLSFTFCFATHHCVYVNLK